MVAFAAVCNYLGPKEYGEGRDAIDDYGCGRLSELLSSKGAKQWNIPTRPSIEAHRMSQEMGMTWCLRAVLF